MFYEECTNQSHNDPSLLDGMVYKLQPNDVSIFAVDAYS